MAHHGYTVEHGFFEGKCPGHNYRPIERARTEADQTVARLEAVAKHEAWEAMELREGRKTPDAVQTHRRQRNLKTGRMEPVTIPWNEASPGQQREEIERRAYAHEARSRGAQSEADRMRRLIEERHGQPLIEVKRAPAPDPIRIGDRRMMATAKAERVVTVIALRPRGGVRFSRDDGFVGHMTGRKWRTLAPAT
jgi:hypothetical protein